MKYNVSMTVTVPDDVSEADAKAWIEYELGYCYSLKISNPLVDTDMEAESVIIRKR